MRTPFAVLTFLLAAPALAAPAPAPSHPFGVRDMQAMDRVGEPVVSPDGKTAVFNVVVTDVDANKRHGSLWLVKVDGTGLRHLTSPDKGSDENPRWSRDGKTLWFLSTRSGSSQIWALPVDGGEAERVTDEPLDVANLAVSPDGKLFSYTMSMFPDCDTAACTRKRVDERAARKATGRLYDSIMVRHWDAWNDGTRSHLFVRATGKNAPSVDVTRGMNADTPSAPFGGPDEIAFTPDSRSLVFSAKLPPRPSEEAWSTNFDLFQVPVDGSAKPKNLTADNAATDTHPIFSPDGKSLVYLAMKRPGYESDRLRIMLTSWPATGKPRVLAEAWDRSPESLIFTRDGKALLATANSSGHQGLFHIDIASGKVTELLNHGTARAPSDAGRSIVFTHESQKTPAEVWSLTGTSAQKLTSFNTERMAATRVGETEELSFPGANGDTVHAWVLKPADFDPARKYPIAFLVHGGPQGSWHDDFHYRWNPEVWAGAGYAVITVDFHGSTGYGQAFIDAINDDWGGKPLVDLQKGLAAATAKYAWMDADRACALGGSYGGWMINWIEGNWPDRFRCLVTHDGNIDEPAAYFETEELWFPEWEHKGTPWENPASYGKANPADHIAKWKTPMLVIHGGNDFRVVDTQGLGTFNVLQRKGIPSRLLFFPDENHWVLKPQNSILWYDTVLSWLDQWTKAGPARAAR